MPQYQPVVPASAIQSQNFHKPLLLLETVPKIGKYSANPRMKLQKSISGNISCNQLVANVVSAARVHIIDKWVGQIFTV